MAQSHLRVIEQLVRLGAHPAVGVAQYLQVFFFICCLLRNVLPRMASFLMVLLTFVFDRRVLRAFDDVVAGVAHLGAAVVIAQFRARILEDGVLCGRNG